VYTKRASVINAHQGDNNLFIKIFIEFYYC
jgi:hypothetical protein